MTAPRELLVVGGGRVGAAVARRALADGASVCVASRSARAHLCLWRHADLAVAPPPVAEGLRVVVVVAPGPRDDPRRLYGQLVPRFVAHALRAGAVVTWVGPAGSGRPAVDAFADGARAAPGATIVRVAPIFGPDDPCVGAVVRRLRETGVARVASVAPCRPIFVDDAVRAILALSGGDHTLLGPEPVTLDDVAAAAVRRFGGASARAWFGPAGVAAAVASQPPADMDTWGSAPGGPRTTVAEWISRLPGLRHSR